MNLRIRNGGLGLVLAGCVVAAGLATTGCRPSGGVAVELVAAAPDVGQVHFRIDQGDLVAETLADGVRPGPRLVVYPDGPDLLLEGRWSQAGRERTWRSRVPWKKGEGLVLEIGVEPEGVRLTRATV